jgi:hypothetical protein
MTLGAIAIGAVLAAASSAGPPPVARFALIIGVNKGPEPELGTLSYADDDAARYQDLFRALGARTYLLTRLDENTRRLHPQAQAEARTPTKAELDLTVQELARDVAKSKERAVPTVLYVVYAGHGNVQDGEGYVLLEDAKLTGEGLLTQVLTPIHADRAHVIVDSCYSFFLAYSRGPGGTRRPISSFSNLGVLAEQPEVGLLLSTSTGRESHEWEGFQAGVFSHEVRSGLYGAADADGDGQVSYREIAAFVQRANQAIPNEKYRPDVLARPPATSTELVDLRAAQDHRIEIDGAHAAHYLLEDSRGVRIADFHNAPETTVALIHPPHDGALYLRRADGSREFEVPRSDGPVTIAWRKPLRPRAHARGAAHDAFSMLFQLPFSESTIPVSEAGLEVGHALDISAVEDRSRARWTGGLLFGGGVASAAVALGFLIDAVANRNAPATASQNEIARRNLSIARDNGFTAGFGLAAAFACLSGVGLFFFGRF